MTRAALARLSAKRATALERLESERAALAAAESALETAKAAQAVLQEAAQAVQDEAHRQIAKVVSSGLSAVYGPGHELRIKFERKRGKTEAEFRYMKDGRRLDPAVNSGGVLDVTSLSLRLTSLILALPPARKTLILDEPFRMVDEESMPRVASLVWKLSEDLGVQFVICTHSKHLRIGRVIRL